MADPITYALADGIAEITLDDGKVNAMSLDLFRGLGAVLDRAEADRPGALVITGRAGAFSAGLNMKLLPTLAPADLRTTLLAFGRTMLRVFTFPIPTVAALSGHAIAGGAMLAFACDLRVMAEGPFRLHLNEVAIGLPLPTWAIVMAESAVPSRWQTDTILHARPYSPDEALERGLVEDVARPANRLRDVAREAAARLKPLDLAAYATAKVRLRARAVRWAEERLEPELATTAPGAGRG
jgi:enoyl-CoA hydratase